ncbi:hypothetical protein A3Q56_02748 [Intoshia linei]|uniref:Core Histone H2A/H2B/H3 domain-containing protein n=1 Tax=Intoshia linei TaxID=1819745 RepID=A0A177B5E1_9BILA|nr:hypothetical protein A3Q56_02748 [Intoshia linei]
MRVKNTPTKNSSFNPILLTSRSTLFSLFLQSQEKRRLKVYKHSIRKLKEKQLLIPLKSFQRIVKDIIGAHGQNFRIQYEALLAIQTAAEDYFISLMKDADFCTKHGKRTTLIPKDIKLALKIRDNNDSLS